MNENFYIIAVCQRLVNEIPTVICSVLDPTLIVLIQKHINEFSMLNTVFHGFVKKIPTVVTLFHMLVNEDTTLIVLIQKHINEFLMLIGSILRLIIKFPTPHSIFFSEAYE